jgi:hypothetical protein
LSGTSQVLIDRYLAFADEGPSLAPKEGPNDGIGAMHDVIGFDGGITKEKVSMVPGDSFLCRHSDISCDDVRNHASCEQQMTIPDGELRELSVSFESHNS